MATIRKLATIEKVLDTLSVARLKSLETLLNSGEKEPKLKTLYNSEHTLKYEDVENGVWLVAIELVKGGEIKTGFLVWENETQALLISYDISQNIYLYEIDVEKSTCVKVKEECSLEELRRVLEDNINKEVVHIDTKGNVEVGKDLVVDGKVILNGKEDLVDTSGNALISGNVLDITPYIDGNTISKEGKDILLDFMQNKGGVVSMDGAPGVKAFFVPGMIIGEKLYFYGCNIMFGEESVVFMDVLVDGYDLIIGTKALKFD